MSDDIFNLEDHRRNRDEDDNLVRCVRCGQRILGTLTRCPKCGVHFQGEAQDFEQESEALQAGKPLWVIFVAIALLIVFIAGALAPALVWLL